MRDYGKLSPFFWTRGSGKRLRGNPDAQVVAIYLSTAPASNMIGIYYVSLASIANDTGIPEARTRAALRAIEDVGYAFYDFADEIVWVPNHAQFEIGLELRPGDKRRPRVYAELRQVDGHRFVNEFRARYGQGYGLTPPIEVVASKSAPHTQMGHPSAKADTEGACASGEQDSIRTGSGSGSGQDRIRGHAPPESGTSVRERTTAPERGGGGIVLGLDGEGGAAWQAWRTGVGLATGRPVSDLGPRDKPDLVALANAHAGGLRGEALMGWITATATAFVKANEARFGFTTKRCRDWLDGGRAEARGSPVPRQPIGSAASAPWMHPTENFDFGAGK